jgi:hypothetical protein
LVPSHVLDNLFNMYYNIGLYFIYLVMVHVRWCISLSPISSPLSEGGTEDPPACVASRWLTATTAPQSTPQGAMSASTDSSATHVDQGSENEAPQLSALFLIKKVGYVISCASPYAGCLHDSCDSESFHRPILTSFRYTVAWKRSSVDGISSATDHTPRPQLTGSQYPSTMLSSSNRCPRAYTMSSLT